MKKLLIFVLLLVVCSATYAQNKDKREYTTGRLNGEHPKIDGLLNDAAWSSVEWQGDFTQHEPYNGKAPTEKTEFKIMYDAENLYIAIKAFDSQPDSIDSRLSHRDDMEGDLVGIQLDSYNDKLTAFSFLVSAAGVKIDMLVSSDGDSEDVTWDAIWNVKTQIDAEGWNAEIQIPLTQLRFSATDEQVWGLQVARFIYRREEFSIWQFISKETSGWVHNFGEMVGLKGIKPQRQIELLPYTVARIETFENESGDPFTNLSRSALSAGLDGKIGITNDFTLDFTVNPDFGQVEADPSEVNLSAYETYFQEKRPFFIEGKNILSFSATPGDMSSDNLFYSRRVGRHPQYYPETADGEYIHSPNNTTILGAFKVTGKTKNGLSVGVMESLTSMEEAEIDNNGTRRKITTEPLTNYFVTRLQKDVNKGNTQFGAMITSTNRKLDDEHLNYMHKAAYTGGIDFTQQFSNRTYFLNAKFMFSQVQGTKEAISETQLSSTHYFQRPDANYMKYDPNRTHLNGHGGILSFGKSGSGKFRFVTWVTWRSPGLELNDVGYIRQADDIMQVFWAGYNIYEPFGIFRSMNLNVNQWAGWDFGGNRKFQGGNFNAHTQFKNFWSTGLGINFEGSNLDNSLLRGGPAVKGTNGFNSWWVIETDSKKKLTFEVFAMNYQGQYKSAIMNNIGLEIGFRPSNAISLEVEPEFSSDVFEFQYITELEYNGEARYVFGKIDQKTLNASIRLNYNISPNLSVQYYGQPFLASGKFSDYKIITNPTADSYYDRFRMLNDNELSYDTENETYMVDENLDGSTDYSFENSNFNALEFKSNLVMRWEYVPGSVLFIVWSQNKGEYASRGVFDFENDAQDLIKAHPYNIFLVKFSYRFNL